MNSRNVSFLCMLYSDNQGRSRQINKDKIYYIPRCLVIDASSLIAKFTSVCVDRIALGTRIYSIPQIIAFFLFFSFLFFSFLFFSFLFFFFLDVLFTITRIRIKRSPKRQHMHHFITPHRIKKASNHLTNKIQHNQTFLHKILKQASDETRAA